MLYRWIEGSRVNLDAQKVGEHLDKLRRKNNGNLTPEAVLEDAARQRSPLHQDFVWDDKEAARIQRLDHAAYIVRSVVVIREEAPKEEPVRAFVVVKDDEGDEHHELIFDALADPRMRRQIVQRAMGELLSVQRRYQRLTELADVFAAIERAQEAVAV